MVSYDFKGDILCSRAGVVFIYCPSYYFFFGLPVNCFIIQAYAISPDVFTTLSGELIYAYPPTALITNLHERFSAFHLISVNALLICWFK